MWQPDLPPQLLQKAGLPESRTYVAPSDRLSGAALREVVKRYCVLSTGWFELRRLPERDD